MLRVGLNGFGRIGRAVFRINQERSAFRVVAVNDLDPNVANHAYLLKYDSTYGRFGRVVEDGPEGMVVDGESIRFYAEASMECVPWADHGVDVIIDATGVHQNVLAAREMVKAGPVKKVVVTHSPKSGVDHTIVFGANEEEYDPACHHVVSSSICDVNAVAPVIRVLSDRFGIEHGYITTLHPWLSYQNLVDGSVRSVSSPTHFWDDFALGRASIMSLIPKQTSLVAALGRVLPEVESQLQAMSFRVPTGIVSASDMTVRLSRSTTIGEVEEVFSSLQGEARRVVNYQHEPLVSIDFSKTEYSAVVDGRWTRVGPDGSVKLVLWYDNEWGYGNRVVDTAILLANDLAEPVRAMIPSA